MVSGARFSGAEKTRQIMTESPQNLRHRIKERLGLRHGRPNFSDPKYHGRAKRLLLDVCDIFNQAQLPYTVDAGTLLGLCRDGDLIPWNNGSPRPTGPRMTNCIAFSKGHTTTP